MNHKKQIALLLAGCLTFSLPACGNKDGGVYVQSVATLSQIGGIAPGDRFAALVVSESVTEIQRDADKTIEELLVKEGDDVAEGQELFAYDTEQIQLGLDKLYLEKEQLESSIENLKNEIAQLEKNRQYAGTRDKLQYTIQIQTNQLDLKEAEINLNTKGNEITKAENLLENATIVSPVTGRVTAVSESGTDNMGNPLPYITIQKAGSYRVKGTLNELQRGGIVEGDRVRMESRTAPGTYWMGTVTLVDYENPSQGNNNNMYYYSDSDDMSSSSKYPFYVELDSSDGLLLGQHLYLQLDDGEEDSDSSGLQLSSAFICFEEDGSSYVWVEKGAKLDKRTVTVGEYDYMRDTYPILDGLAESDFIAFPDESCISGAATTHTQPQTQIEVEEGGM